MVKHHKNKKKYKDSEPDPLFNTCQEGRGKKGAHTGVRGKQKNQEMKEEEQNDLRKTQQDKAEGMKMEHRIEEGRKEEDRMLRDSYQDMEEKIRYTTFQKNLKTLGEGKRNG
jgi:hypothetical protein